MFFTAVFGQVRQLCVRFDNNMEWMNTVYHGYDRRATPIFTSTFGAPLARVTL